MVKEYLMNVQVAVKSKLFHAIKSDKLVECIW